jgi:hypothetical protein
MVQDIASGELRTFHHLPPLICRSTPHYLPYDCLRVGHGEKSSEGAS